MQPRLMRATGVHTKPAKRGKVRAAGQKRQRFGYTAHFICLVLHAEHPFVSFISSSSVMQTTLRTHHCGELRQAHIGQTVSLTGWVHNVRDLGKFAFLILRDRYGITQVAVYAEQHKTVYEQLKGLGREYVVRVTGEVRAREAPNEELATGQVEVLPRQLEILNPAKLPPFLIENETDGHEDLRLQHRYLDLRRPVIAQNLALRAKVVRAIRSYLDQQAFLEIETPCMIKTTPEGARDFLVPSRLQPGTFYALAQSPQILKQLMMVGGLDRYYQVCKCFRDEDFRGDRQPEFTQIDCEMAFVGQEDVLNVFGGMVQHVFQQVMNIDLPEIPRFTYEEVLRRFGSDKPDMRFGCELQELHHVPAIANTEFKVFRNVLESENGKIIGLNATGCAGYSRKQLDSLTGLAKQYGAKGLVWMKYNPDGSTKSSVDKFFDAEQRKEILEGIGCQPGDLGLIVADGVHTARKVGGALRLHLAKTEGWIDESRWDVFFVVDFPLFERDEETGELQPMHHPFVMPHPEDRDKLHTDPENVRTWCYDLVINGNEIMSGSVRIHERALQEEIFQLLNISPEEQEAKFGFMLRAFEYGAPPHAGCAFGLDRWVMLFAGAETLRDVIAFPKNSAGRDMMLEAPAPIDEEQLRALGLQQKA